MRVSASFLAFQPWSVRVRSVVAMALPLIATGQVVAATESKAAAVLHFCGLGYSRPGDKPRPEGGATSDDFIDIAALEFEPLFKKYVRMAFNPVGLMLDFWEEKVVAGSGHDVRVYVINDWQEPWRGEVRLRGGAAGSGDRDAEVAGSGHGREVHGGRRTGGSQ